MPKTEMKNKIHFILFHRVRTSDETWVYGCWNQSRIIPMEVAGRAKMEKSMWSSFRCKGSFQLRWRGVQWVLQVIRKKRKDQWKESGLPRLAKNPLRIGKSAESISILYLKGSILNDTKNILMNRYGFLEKN